MKAKYFVAVIAAVAAIGGLLFGFDTGVISGAILFIDKQFHLTPFMNGIVVSAVLFGAFIGALSGGRVADKFGRRALLLITAIIFILSTLASALAPSEIWLILSRMVVGMAIGMASFVSPLYIAEIAPAEYRGRLVSLYQLLVTIGIVVSYFTDYHFAKIESWRWMLGIGVIPAILLFLGVLFLPKSPRWLVAHGKIDAAKNILKRIRTGDIDIELTAIKESLLDVATTWKTTFKRWMLPAVFVSVGLEFVQQITGINTIIYYAPTIFKFAGFHNETTAILATTGVGCVNVLFTIIAMTLIDKIGRRPLLLVGVTGMAISLIGLGIAFDLPSYAHMLKWIALACMLLYIPCFAASLGPIAWLIISEVFPLRVRGLASSIAASSNWFFNMLVALTFLSLMHHLGKGNTFLLYGFICIGSGLFIYFFIPETKDVSLEHIEKNLRAGKRCRELGN